jgi:hypothetical protein
VTHEEASMERLIGSARRYLAAITMLGATTTRTEWEAAKPAVEAAKHHLQEAVLDIGVVVWLAHVDD